MSIRKGTWIFLNLGWRDLNISDNNIGYIVYKCPNYHENMC